MTYAEAEVIALNRNAKFNQCVEYEDAWVFSYERGDTEVEYGGPNTPTVIMKKSGEVLFAHQYYLGGYCKCDINEYKIYKIERTE